MSDADDRHRPVPSAGPDGDPDGDPAGGRRNGHGRAGLVLSLVALCTFWIPLLYLLLAVPSGILGVVHGVKGRRLAAEGEATNPGEARAAVICGIVALALCLLNLALGALLATNYTGG